MYLSLLPPTVVNPWIIKHIFPGGYVPSLSEMSAGAESAQFMFTDIEVLRLHYAKTLRAWYGRFQANRKQISTEVGEAFCRMWEFYLAVCASKSRKTGLDFPLASLRTPKSDRLLAGEYHPQVVVNIHNSAGIPVVKAARGSESTE